MPHRPQSELSYLHKILEIVGFGSFTIFAMCSQFVFKFVFKCSQFVYNVFTVCIQIFRIVYKMFTVCIQMFTICLQNVHSLYTNVHNLFTKCSQSVYNMLKVKHSFSLLYFGRGAHKVHFVIL